MEIKDKKADIISKLLAKAESTTPEEAQILTERAEEMMAKYMVDQAMVDARREAEGKASEEIITQQIMCAGSYRKALMWLTVAVARAYGNLELMKSNDDGKRIVVRVVGFESDVQQFLTLANSLHIQAFVSLQSWWRVAGGDYMGERSYNRWEARSAFLSAFGRGAAERLSASRNRVVQEAGSGTELVLVERGDKVRQYLSQNFSTQPSRRMKNSYDYGASAAGRAAGLQANTGEKPVQGSRTEIG